MTRIHSPLEALAARRLLDLPEAESEALREAVETAERKRRLLHRVRAGARPRPHPISLTPFVLPRRLLPDLHRLAQAVHRLQTQAPALYRARALNVREICPLDDVAEAWFSRYYRGSGRWDLLIRLDVGLGSNGRPRLYETNATALAGLFNHSGGVEILRTTVFPRLLSLRERRGLQDPPDLLALVFEWVIRSAARLGIPRRSLGVAFLEPAGPTDGFSEIPQIARYFASRGVVASCGEPQQLRLDGERVRLQGHPVDLAYRDLEFRDMPDPGRAGSRLAGFVALLEKRATLPGFSGEFDHKGILEALTSPAYRRFFSPRERRLLAAAVPWTRVLWARKTEGPDGEPIDLPRYARANKDRLVLKPNRGSGGDAVVLGREASASHWERRIERALAEPGALVVQERFEAVQKPMVYLQDNDLHSAPCHFSLGLFYVQGQLGLHCRVSPHPIVNVARGGALACVFLGA